MIYLHQAGLCLLPFCVALHPCVLQGRPSNKKIQKVPSYLLPLKIRKWGMESTFVPFLKIRKWELRSSEMAHREAKTEYLGAYNFFTPVSSGNLPYGPLATPEKAIREFSFLIYPPRGEILCKKSPLEGIFHQYFLKKVHFLKCTFCFLKMGGSWR